MARIHVPHYDIKAAGKKIILYILIRMEIPDKIEEHNIFRQFIDCCGGTIFGHRLQHIRPYHHAQAAGFEIIVIPYDIGSVKIGGIFLLTNRAYAYLVHLVVPHVDKFTRSYDIENFVKNIK